MAKLEMVLKRFDEPDEVRRFEKGKFELVRIGGMAIGRATYEPIPPGPPGHDSWVVDDAPYVSLHFLGTEHYANK